MSEQFKPTPGIPADDRLEELDPEVTDRLTRALDRFQMAQPYQQLSGRRSDSTGSKTETGPLPELTPEQQAMREAFVTQELSSLVMLAGQLNQELGAERIKAAPDRHFRDSLKAELQQAARQKKTDPKEETR
jgi:hypothetical protein